MESAFIQDKNCRHASRTGGDCQTPGIKKAAIPAQMAAELSSGGNHDDNLGTELLRS
jgi:hypothetical protein